MGFLNSKQFPFWNITLTILFVLTLTTLVQDGMFSDGVLYASVSKNLAHGKGSFWYPYFNETMFPFFHQQPPLTFGIQSLFFKIFGDSIYVERFYSLLTLCISVFLIHRLWLVVHKEELQEVSFLPVLFWIIIPISYWAYSNNVEENTMGIFTLWSTIYLYKGMNREKPALAYLVAGSLLAVIASLCKGFPGLFPIAVPFFYGLVFRSCSFGKMIFYSFITTGTVLLTYSLLLLLNSDAYNSLSAYLQDRVINSIQNESTEDDRVYLIKQLALELLSPTALMIILAMLLRLANFRIRQTLEQKKNTLLFLYIGLSASIPLIVTLEQRRFYLSTALPYYAIALATLIAPAIQGWMSTLSVTTRKFKTFRLLSLLLVFLSIAYSYSFLGNASRDQDKLHDVYLLGKIISPDQTIGVSAETWDDWGLHNYFVRHFNISLDKKENSNHKYFLVDKLQDNIPSAAYTKLEETTLRYDLYKKKAE
jgi:4-amino-4-deoxy-L-arabinose transferase-like glycosyltransferase